MIRNYDHRAAGVSENLENVHNPALSTVTNDERKLDPAFLPDPQYWVPAADKRLIGLPQWILAFRDIARITDMRTVITAIVPTPAAGNTLPLLLPKDISQKNYSKIATLLLATMNSLVFDFVARQKVQSTHLNWYIAEQLPTLDRKAFDLKIGSNKIVNFVVGEALRLSYTAEDLRPFAHDLGYEGDPFVWDEEDRRHRMARLDALFFHLYGVNRDDADYILNTFPIVRERDERQFGRFRTRDLVLGYINAIAAGDLDTLINT